MWVIWNLVLVRLETVSVLVQYRCTICAKCTLGTEIVWPHPMVLLGDEAQLEARFDPFRNSANLNTRPMHGLRRTYHRLRNRFGHSRWNTKVSWVMWNLVSVRLETVLVSMQDRCTICVQRTKGSEIILDALDGIPR
jgi:hypothetical protein